MILFSTEKVEEALKYLPEPPSSQLFHFLTDNTNKYRVLLHEKKPEWAETRFRRPDRIIYIDSNLHSEENLQQSIPQC